MSPLLTVHRVEHETATETRYSTDDGRPVPYYRGPFGEGLGLDAAAMPTPWSDVPAQEDHRPLSDSGGIYGFPSLAHLASWFTVRDRERLAARGYVIRTYRVPAGAATLLTQQVVFDPGVALAVRVRRLTDLTPDNA
jgi:hypothetical protein